MVHDLPGVGAHLHDHADVVLGYDAPHLKDLFGISPAGLANAIRGIFDGGRQRSGMLTTNFAEAGGFIKSQPGEATPDLQLHFVIGQLVDHGRKTVFGHGYSCHVSGRGEPRQRAPASNDRLPRRASIRTSSPERDDVDRLVRGVKADAAHPAAAGARRLRREGVPGVGQGAGRRADRTFVRSHADTIYHPVAVAAWDRPGRRGRCRTPGAWRGGLRVVDASIMPRVVSGNTNAPTIMIAERPPT